MKTKTMLQRLIAALLALCLVLGLSGCGRRRPSGRDPSSSSPTAASASTTSRRRKTNTPTGDLDDGDTIRSRRAAAAADAADDKESGRRQGSSDDLRNRRRGSATPSPSATPAPIQPTGQPTATPDTTRPTETPSNRPTAAPTAQPTAAPTTAPTAVPTAAPAPASSLLQRVIDGVVLAEYPIELDCSYEEFMDVYEVLSDDPSYFWIRGYQASYTSTHVSVYFIYTHDTAQSIADTQQKIEQVAQKVLAGADPNATEVEKALYLHDWLLQNITYISDGGWHDQTLYGALVKQECVCAGISRAFTYLARKMGLDADTVIGYAGGNAAETAQIVASGDPNHAWNALTIDGSTSYLDVTWDNTDDRNSSNREYLMHTWLGVSLEEMIVTHVPDDPAYELPTHTDAHNYFVYYDYNMPTFDYQKTLSRLQYQKDQGFTMLEMRFPTESAYQAALKSRTELYWALGGSGYSSNDELRIITFWM